MTRPTPDPSSPTAPASAGFGPMTEPDLFLEDLTIQDVWSALRVALRVYRIARIVMPHLRAWWARRRAARPTGSARR